MIIYPPCIEGHSRKGRYGIVWTNMAPDDIWVHTTEEGYLTLNTAVFHHVTKDQHPGERVVPVGRREPRA